MEKYDIAIIGGGILGVCVAYWLSTLYDIKICLIEKEVNVAMHTSSRNTGVVHSPFYLNPQKKKQLAKAAFLSHDLWKRFADKYHLAWSPVGTIKIALSESQHATLEKYLKWGVANGIDENNLELLYSNQIKHKEPYVKCYSGLYCKSDVSVDFGQFTLQLKKELEKNNVKLLFNSTFIDATIRDDITIKLADSSTVCCKFLINCAGGNSLDIAQKFGLASQYSDLHFRGEYWIANKNCADLVKTNIYTVAKFPQFPFLDPHWIKRANGDTEIGPNAVPVFTPDTYDGFLSDANSMISKITQMVTSGTLKLLQNPDFLSLLSCELPSSISKTAMVNRVKQFIPNVRPSYFDQKGTSGIRSPLVSPDGKFVDDVFELHTVNSFHILNYNSPGATGAPAYSAFIVKQLENLGFLRHKNNVDSIWDFEKIIANS